MKSTVLQSSAGHTTRLPSNTQDFSESGDDIVDNFAEGPDDGMPMGVGGEQGKQSEPASSTLEADIVSGKKQLPGEMPEEPASGSTSVQEPAGETVSETTPDTDDGEPEIPPMLLQMAGYADAAAAEADGLGTVEALNAFVRGRGKLLDSQVESQAGPAPTAGNPYVQQQKQPQQAEPTESDLGSEFQPFELTAEEREVLDESLVDTIDRMNAHHQKQFDKQLEMVRGSIGKSEEQQAMAEAMEFDKAVQALGDDWQDVFGEGSIDDLSRRAQREPIAGLAHAYRVDLFRNVQAIRDANAARGLEPMSLQQELGFALMQRFPDKFQQTTSAKSGRTTLNRPSQRQSQQRPQEPLLKKLHRKFPKGGFTMSDADDMEGEF